MPIGLVDASWGGTFIEAWSPPEALASCGVDDDGVGNAQNHNEYLWNAMVHPFLRMSIRGVLWYQVPEYDCIVATTSRPALCAVQVLKIRRPNYSDFSVKTMVIMKLLQQQNGNTVVVEKFKSEFYVEI